MKVNEVKWLKWLIPFILFILRKLKCFIHWKSTLAHSREFIRQVVIKRFIEKIRVKRMILEVEVESF